MRYLALFLFLSIQSSFVAAQGIDFFHGTFEEALEAAKTQEKVIFVDAYTTWCGPCKKMAKNVFTAPEVGEFFNANFISLKLDMEKTPGRKFQQKYPVSAYPTFYFIDEKGESLQMAKGAMPAEKFLGLARSVLGKIDNSGEYAKKYEEGDRDPELVYNYVKALNKAGKPSLKIANEYLNSQKDLNTEQNLKFLLEATIEADSRIFDLMIKHRKGIEKVSSAEIVNKKIESACKKTLNKALAFESDRLLSEAKSKMKANYADKASAFAYKADMAFYKKMGDTKNYCKTCNSYVKKQVKNDANQLDQIAIDLCKNFAKDADAMQLAEKISKKAAANGGLAKYYSTYASILLNNGKKQEALKSAQKSLELSKGNALDENAARRLISTIEKS